MNAVEYMHGRGLHSEALIAAVKPEIRSDRIWIGWFDEFGQEIYRKGRALNGAPEKYLPDKKGPRPALFGTPGAWAADKVALVEGEFDALLAEQAGFPAFATGSASLSEATKAQGMDLLARKRPVILVTDRDDAGARWREEIRSLLGARVPLVEGILPEACKDLGDLAELAMRVDMDPALAIRNLLTELARLDGRPAARDIVEIALEAPEDLTELDVITQVLRRQSILLVTGEEGDGKTMFADQLVRQMMRRELIFDHFSIGPHRPRKVLFVDTEMLDDQVRARAAEMDRRGLGVAPGSIEWVCAGGLDLAHSAEDKLYIEGEIARTGADFLWTDSGGNAVDKPKDDESVKPFFNWCDGLLREVLIGMGLTLHPRKRPAQAEGGRRFDDLFGSREWKGRAYTAFYLEDKRITAWKDRGFGLHRMWPTKGHYARASLERPGIEDQTCPPFRISLAPIEEVNLEELKAQILRLIEDSPGDLNQTAIEKNKEITARAEFTRGVVKDLLKEGLIVGRGGDKRGRGQKFSPSDDHIAWQAQLLEDGPVEEDEELDVLD